MRTTDQNRTYLPGERLQWVWPKLGRYERLKLHTRRLLLASWLRLRLPRTVEGLEFSWGERYDFFKGIAPLYCFGYLLIVAPVNLLRLVRGELELWSALAGLTAVGLFTWHSFRRVYKHYGLWCFYDPSTALSLERSELDGVRWLFHRRVEQGWQAEQFSEFPAQLVEHWWDPEGHTPLEGVLAAQQLEQLMMGRMAAVVGERFREEP